MLVALRLLSVARFNPETAYGILQASGTGDVIIGTVISLIPSIAIIAGSALSLGLIFSRSRKPSATAEFAVWISIFVLILIAVLTIPFRYVYVAIPVIPLVVLTAVPPLRKKIERSRNGRARKTAAIISALLIAILLMFGVVLSPPWMPAERLILSNHHAVTGYILAENSNGLTILGLEPRQIMYYSPDALIGQSICSSSPANDLPIIYYTGISKFIGLFPYKHC